MIFEGEMFGKKTSVEEDSKLFTKGAICKEYVLFELLEILYWSTSCINSYLDYGRFPRLLFCQNSLRPFSLFPQIFFL